MPPSTATPRSRRSRNGGPAKAAGWCWRPRKAAIPYTDFAFRADDVLLLGRESAGVPDAVHALADARVVVPMVAGARSLNVAVAGAMIAGEALRQRAGLRFDAPLAS